MTQDLWGKTVTEQNGALEEEGGQEEGQEVKVNWEIWNVDEEEVGEEEEEEEGSGNNLNCTTFW